MEKKILDYYYRSESDNRILSYQEIPYTTYLEKINGNDFRKHYIIDFNILNNSQIYYVLADFDNFQHQLMSDDYYNYRNTKFPCSLVLHLVKFPENKNGYIYLNNMAYASKRIDDTIKVEDRNIIINNQRSEFIFNDQLFHITNFNLIYGNNSTGKSLLLRNYAKNKNIDIFHPVINFENGHYLTTVKERLMNLKKIIGYCNENKIPILIDDIFWGSYDSRNMIRIIDTLYESSFDNQVIFTSEQELPKRLVLSRTHEPNIIDLNERKIQL